MMRLGLIGGTAMNRLAADEIEISRLDDIVAQTRYGEVPLTCVQTGGHELIFLERHHGEGTTPPHNINGSLLIQHLNVRSLYPKIHEIQHLLSSQKPHILGISESWLNNSLMTQKFLYLVLLLSVKIDF